MSPRAIGFLADHDPNDRITDGVIRREPPIVFLRTRQLGLADRPDDDVLDEAARLGLIVDSHDVNTTTAAALDRLASGRGLSGLSLIPQRLPPRVAIDALLMIWSASDAAEWRDRTEFLPP